MPKLIYVDSNDEISDLVDSVKTATESDIALVVPNRTRAFQTPLNVRLLSQFATSSAKTVSIVTDDARIQQMTRAGGFPTFSSLAAMERGVETVRPTHTPPVITSAALLDAAPSTLESSAPVAVASKPTATELSSAWTQQRSANSAGVPPRKPNTTGPRDRRPLYFAGVAIAVIGVLLFLFVAPSATVTVTLQATPLAVNPVIQGTTDNTVAKQGDHILTQVVTDKETATFQATPTGVKQLPATASSGTVTISLRVGAQSGYFLQIPSGTEFDNADGSMKFVSTQLTNVYFAANGPSQWDQGKVNDQPGAANAQIPVQADTAGASTNVGTGTITVWPGNPCFSPPQQWPGCSDTTKNSADVQVTNPASTSGGADAKNITVASAQDVANFQNQLNTLNGNLTGTANAAISSKTNGDVVAKDPSGGGEQVQCSPSPALPAADAQYAPTQITITCTATAAVYALADVKAALISDLTANVPQGEQLITDQVGFAPVQVTQAGIDGTVILSDRATGYSHPSVDLAALTPQITGKSPGDLRNFFRGHNVQVTNVVVKESPISLPILPLFSSRIKIVAVFQSGAAPGS